MSNGGSQGRLSYSLPQPPLLPWDLRHPALLAPGCPADNMRRRPCSGPWAAPDLWGSLYTCPPTLSTSAPQGSPSQTCPPLACLLPEHRLLRGDGVWQYLDPVHRVMNDGGLRLLQKKEAEEGKREVSRAGGGRGGGQRSQDGRRQSGLGRPGWAQRWAESKRVCPRSVGDSMGAPGRKTGPPLPWLPQHGGGTVLRMSWGWSGTWDGQGLRRGWLCGTLPSWTEAAPTCEMAIWQTQPSCGHVGLAPRGGPVAHGNTTRALRKLNLCASKPQQATVGTQLHHSTPAPPAGASPGQDPPGKGQSQNPRASPSGQPQASTATDVHLPGRWGTCGPRPLMGRYPGWISTRETAKGSCLPQITGRAPRP